MVSLECSNAGGRAETETTVIKDKAKIITTSRLIAKTYLKLSILNHKYKTAGGHK